MSEINQYFSQPLSAQELEKLKTESEREGSPLVHIAPMRTQLDIASAIAKMHDMYSLPHPGIPTLEYQRAESFAEILNAEASEVDEIHAMNNRRDQILEEMGQCGHEEFALFNELAAQASELEIQILVAWSDWLNDIIVYALSEQMRLGLDPFLALGAIMASNLTKLGADGKPIKNPQTGKVEKGPNFRKPEPTLGAIIRAQMATAADIDQMDFPF